MIPTRPELYRAAGKATHGTLVRTSTVSSFTTVTVSMLSNAKRKRSELRPGYFPRYASRLFFTTVASRRDPSWKVTLGRRLMVQVR
jgi:hypothetical protein